MAFEVTNRPGSVKSIGQQFYTVTTTALALTAIPAAGRWFSAICETAAVRWRDDLTAPTVSIGIPLATAVTMQYSDAANFANIRFIAQSGVSTLNVAWYGDP